MTMLVEWYAKQLPQWTFCTFGTGHVFGKFYVVVVPNGYREVYSHANIQNVSDWEIAHLGMNEAFGRKWCAAYSWGAFKDYPSEHGVELLMRLEFTQQEGWIPNFDHRELIDEAIRQIHETAVLGA